MTPKIVADERDTTNPFLALVAAMWKRGEDGEILARELYAAFVWTTHNGGRNPEDEFRRFDRESEFIIKDHRS